MTMVLTSLSESVLNLPGLFALLLPNTATVRGYSLGEIVLIQSVCNSIHEESYSPQKPGFTRARETLMILQIVLSLD